MYWSRVKTILIILFLAVDVFLLTNILLSRHDPTVISPESINDVVSILQRNNITVNPDIIPAKTEYMGVVELDNVWVDNEKTAKLLIGESAQLQTTAQYVNGSKQITFGAKEFFYTNPSPAENISADKTISDVANVLNTMSINANPKMGDIYENTLTFVQDIKLKPIFETTLKINITGNGIDKMEGYWLISHKQTNMTQRPVTLLKPSTSILIDFIHNPDIDTDGNITISSISTGYTLGSAERDTTHKLVSIFPAYKITLSDGKYYMYDATTGDYLYPSA